MVNTKKFNTVRTEWYEEQIKEFKKINPDKTFSLLLWEDDKFGIAEQLNTALQKDVDYVFTEILPHNLPNTCSIKEYKFLIDRFIRLEPCISGHISNNESKKKRKFVVDKEFEVKFLKNPIIKKQIYELCDNKEVIEDILNGVSNYDLNNYEEVYVFAFNPILIHLINQIYRFYSGKKIFFILSNNLNEVELFQDDVDVITLKQDTSLRSFVSNVMQPKILPKDKRKFVKLDEYTETLKKFIYTKETVFENGNFNKNKNIDIYNLKYQFTQIRESKEYSQEKLCLILSFLLETDELENPNVLKFILNIFEKDNLNSSQKALSCFKSNRNFEKGDCERFLNKMISSLIRNSNHVSSQHINLNLKQFQNFNVTKASLEFHNFIIDSLQDRVQLIYKTLIFIKEHKYYHRFKTLAIKLLFCNISLSKDEFNAIANSGLFNSNELFKIIKANFNLNIFNLHDNLGKDEFVDFIEILKSTDSTFFKREYKGFLGEFTRLIVAHHFAIYDLDNSVEKLTSIDKILLNSYCKLTNIYKFDFNKNDVINSLGLATDKSFEKTLFDDLKKDDMNFNIIFSNSFEKSTHSVELLLLHHLSIIHRYDSLTSNCFRILKNHFRSFDKVTHFIRQNS